MPLICAAVGALRVLDPFDLWVARLLDQLRQHLQQRALVCRRRAREEVAHDLDILLRHATSIAQPGAGTAR